MDREKIRAQVIEDLKNYPELKKKVVLIRYEPAMSWITPPRSQMAR